MTVSAIFSAVLVAVLSSITLLLMFLAAPVATLAFYSGLVGAIALDNLYRQTV